MTKYYKHTTLSISGEYAVKIWGRDGDGGILPFVKARIVGVGAGRILISFEIKLLAARRGGARVKLPGSRRNGQAFVFGRGGHKTMTHPRQS